MRPSFFKTNIYFSDDSRLPSNLKWYWRCLLRNYFMKLLSISFGVMSVVVIWSECTFWVRKPTLSIFALLVEHWSLKHNYFNLELFCFISIAYLCFCAYWTLFQIKVFLFFLNFFLDELFSVIFVCFVGSFDFCIWILFDHFCELFFLNFFPIFCWTFLWTFSNIFLIKKATYELFSNFFMNFFPIFSW